MGIARRIAEVYEAKVNALLNRVEDPREMVDYSYSQQQELLANVRRGMVEVTAGARRAARQADDVGQHAARLRAQAEQAMAAGDEELARQALARRQTLLARQSDLRQQQAALEADQQRLRAAAERLRAKTDQFAVRKEAIKSDYTTARLTAEVTGMSEEMGDAGLAAQRASDSTAQAHARADALDEILTPGGTADEMFPATAGPAAPAPEPGHLPESELQSRLDEISTRVAVDAELARIKERLAAGG